MLDEAILAAAHETLHRLRAQGLTAVTAESCTGGLVAASLTHHAGSSDVLLGGFVTYANAMKQTVLGVDADLLARFGAVSEPVALAMAEGALARSGAHRAVSITGIAGPGGGASDKPVGLVWFALAQRLGASRSLREVFAGDRAAVRSQSVRCALALLAGQDP